MACKAWQTHRGNAFIYSIFGTIIFLVSGPWLLKGCIDTFIQTLFFFSAMASIEGNKVTTFDGLTYDLEGTCTYVLAKDYVDGNFSLALKRDPVTSLIIMADKTTIELLPQGQVGPLSLFLKLHHKNVFTVYGQQSCSSASTSANSEKWLVSSLEL